MSSEILKGFHAITPFLVYWENFPIYKKSLQRKSEKIKTRFPPGFGWNIYFPPPARRTTKVRKKGGGTKGGNTMNELLFPIPQDILTSTIESMRDYQLRLEVEAAALAGLTDPAAQELAQERLEQAGRVKTLFQHYSRL